MHYYSKKYYESHIKEAFEGRKESEHRRAKLAGETPVADVLLRSAITEEYWNEETPAHQKEIKDARERDYLIAVKGWEASLATSPTRTAEEMATYVFFHLAGAPR